jgi:hypothetical protein
MVLHPVTSSIADREPDGLSPSIPDRPMTARQDDLITSYEIFRKRQLPQPRGGHPRDGGVDHMQ